MNWMSILAIVVAGTVSALTDWLFMGVLFHDRYNTYPETWWPRSGPDAERSSIIWSTALGYITAAAVVLLCMFVDPANSNRAFEVALLAWVAGPLVVVITNGVWIRIDRAVTLAHALGYLARFLIAAGAYRVLVR
jgi:hypothetical protein